jgi:hypothetical protein
MSDDSDGSREALFCLMSDAAFDDRFRLPRCGPDRRISRDRLDDLEMIMAAGDAVWVDLDKPVCFCGYVMLGWQDLDVDDWLDSMDEFVLVDFSVYYFFSNLVDFGVDGLMYHCYFQLD